MLPMFTSPIKQKRKTSHFYICIKIDGNKSKTQFRKKLQEMTNRVRKLTPKNKKNVVMMPNDPEILTSKKRSKNGIPISEALYKEFIEISKNLKIKIDF